MLYQEIEDGYISNLYNYQLVNKTEDSSQVSFKLMNIEGKIRYVGEPPRLIPGEVAKGALFIDIPKDVIKNRKTKINLDLMAGDKLMDHTSTNFLGPKR